jgi:hypothetical protein
VGDNDGGDGIELRNTNGNGTAEAVPITKGQIRKAKTRQMLTPTIPMLL